MMLPTHVLMPPHRARHLVGHADAIAGLAQALRSGRMPHAWMLCGPQGIGKATLAFQVARFLLANPDAARHAQDRPRSGDDVNDERSLPDRAPEKAWPGRFECSADAPAARKIAAGAHPDLLTIERPPIKADETKSADEDRRKTAEIPVDTARRIPPFLHRTPAEGGWRIVIVDEADRLNRNAANAILKVIEEPPRQALIFLICNRPGAMLPTIRSRCRRLMLTPPETDAVVDLLTGSGIVTDRRQAGILARLAEGSPGKAIELHEGDAVGLFETLTKILGQGARLDIQAATAVADRISRPTAEAAYRAFQSLTGHIVSGVLRAAATGRADGAILEHEDAIIAAGIRSGLDPWLEVWDKINHLFASADRVHLDRRQIAINVVMLLDDTLRRSSP